MRTSHALLHWVELLFQSGAFPHCNRVRLPRHLFAHLWHLTFDIWHLRQRQKCWTKFDEAARKGSMTWMRLQGSSRQAYCTSVDSAVFFKSVANLNYLASMFREFGIRLRMPTTDLNQLLTGELGLTSGIHYMDCLCRLWVFGQYLVMTVEGLTHSQGFSQRLTWTELLDVFISTEYYWVLR